MSDNKKPFGYFRYLLAADCETSGMAFSVDDPSYNPKTGERYQAVSWGLAVVDADILKVVDTLYVEIQFDPAKYTWNDKAQKVHGMSQEYLAKNGVSMEDAVMDIAELVLKYWGPSSPICLLGHNVIAFDLPFLRSTMRTQDIELKFGARHVDTMAIAYSVFGSYSSDEVFEAIGLQARDPNAHNALVDAINAVKVVQAARKIADKVLG